ncbi:hypothetical protein [Buchnera aphidicola]|uniref:hypothetical protein n=1 Tax=Buchnera aphidicola TaxID=9 RepID=UPI003464BF39
MYDCYYWIKKKNFLKICKKLLRKKKISLACINSNTQIIITGNKKNIKKASKKCKKFGAKHIIKLPINTISHCSSMKNIRNLLFKKCQKISFKKPKYLIVDSAKIKFIKNSIKMKNYLINQLTQTINWEKTINLIISKNIHYFIEVSTSNILNKLNHNKKNYIPIYLNKIFNLK